MTRGKPLSSVDGKLHPMRTSNNDSPPESHDSFQIAIADLSLLCEERTRAALASLLEKFVHSTVGEKAAVLSYSNNHNGSVDIESNYVNNSGDGPRIREIISALNSMEESEYSRDRSAEDAAIVLTTQILRSSPESGLSTLPSELEHRRIIFGSNAIADKKLSSFLALCFEAVQDFVLIALIVMGTLEIALNSTLGTGKKGEKCGSCWIEGAAILVSVAIIVLVTASIDYAKQFAFKRLTKSLDDSNTKVVIRGGERINVTDAEIVVGDILSVNSHNLASIPADCVLLGPMNDLKMDESSLTGESKLITKKPGDVILSGTTAVQGTGKMVVIAVGVNSVAGKIKARVYESEGGEDGLSGEDEDSPLFVKLTALAKRIGIIGFIAAISAFVVSACVGLVIEKAPTTDLIKYFLLSVTVLAVAVPEGLPLAVTLALAYSSNKMMKEQNLVKHLDACETMGCATTICTDKTGTLTANKMTARAIYSCKFNFVCTDPSISLGKFILEHANRLSQAVIEILCNLIAVDTMNDTVLYYDSGKVTGSSGNPTEVALLQLVQDLQYDYREIRKSTRGRADEGILADYVHEGKPINFSSARKMMSWVVPLSNGGYRVYCKGASEVIISRCTSHICGDQSIENVDQSTLQDIMTTSEMYSRRGMRCLGLAYRDLPSGVDLEATVDTVKNSDGSDALYIETSLTFLALIGIEDPLRPEVPVAIQKCYEAGIDVRLVTGDNPNTAVSIAYQAGILRDFHFVLDGQDPGKHPEMVAANLKPNVLLEGKDFRKKVYRILDDGSKTFDQVAFDQIWPHLRVLARSSPDDKLTLAHGLNQSTLYTDKATCNRLRSEHNITIFPDRQVVAMTGDGTNDAPALKRSDIGFAMGIAGTQIAKDAADIILLDDNFASIVTAAKWGRNVYASIQKFLQFQLTVNLSAVVTALIGAFTHQTSPLAAIHLLWVNLLMDALASLALASEPPTEAMLKRPPVNRSESMITSRMYANMLGQFSYQITIIMILLFKGPDIFGFEPGWIVEEGGENSVHYTFIFNSFVWMQLFNEINSRNLLGEANVFRGLLKNNLFCLVLLTTSAAQAVIVEFGDKAMHVHEKGLDGKYWGISIAFGVGSLLMQQIINIFYWIGSSFKLWRQKKRLNRDRSLSKRSIDVRSH